MVEAFVLINATNQENIAFPFSEKKTKNFVKGKKTVINQTKKDANNCVITETQIKASTLMEYLFSESTKRNRE